MSYLRKFAREKADEKKNKQFTVRVPQKFYDRFMDHINQLGLNLNESIYLLMQNELGENKKKVNRHTIVTQKDVKKGDKVMHDKNEKMIDSDSENKRIVRGRFTVEPWVVNGYVPCPLCRKWYSRTNFSRHARTVHNLTTEELLTSYKEGADEMAREE